MNARCAILLFGLLTWRVLADGRLNDPVESTASRVGKSYNQRLAAERAKVEQAKRKAAEAKLDQMEAELRKTRLAEWRNVRGVLTRRDAPGWFDIRGKILESRPGTARLLAQAEPVSIGAWSEQWETALRRGKAVTLWVTNFNELIADGGFVTLIAKATGLIRYTTVQGAVATIDAYDCGIPATAPEWFIEQQQQAAERARSLARERAVRATNDARRVVERVVRFQREQAEKGLPSFQYELGARYMNGDGVETNRALAVQWLQKAAAQGESRAEKLLQSIAGTR